MSVAAFDEYTRRLVSVATADPRIRGVALLGSGADPSRIDEWSDHDIALVVDADAVEAFRGSTDWLPGSERLAAVGREWHDGFKAVFDDGRVIEYAVTDLDGLRGFPLVAADVVFDRGGVAEAVAVAASGTETRRLSPAGPLAAAFLVQLLVGVGRVRRGERLSGGDVVRSEAALTLVDLWLAVCRPDDRHPDPFDGRRRIESLDASFAARLEETLAQDAEQAARDLLRLAEATLVPAWPDWPARGADAVRRRLGWTAA